MLLRLRISAYDEDAPVGDVRPRRPDLLPVDHPLVTVEHRASPRARKVGPGARLGEPLTPDLVPGQDVREVALLLLVTAPHRDRRSGHAEPDHADVAGRLGPRCLFEVDALEGVRRALPAELLG